MVCFTEKTRYKNKYILSQSGDMVKVITSVLVHCVNVIKSTCTHDMPFSM